MEHEPADDARIGEGDADLHLAVDRHVTVSTSPLNGTGWPLMLITWNGDLMDVEDVQLVGRVA